ncbi:MAG: hypothetical protein WD871_05140 [Xanthobacteraceae bacterium]
MIPDAAAGRQFLRNARAAYERNDWPAAIKFFQSALDAYGDNVPRGTSLWLRKAQRAQIAEDSLRKNKVIFRAVADPDKVIWIHPTHIRYKVRSSDKLNQNDILSGDWDLSRITIEEMLKFKSVVQRFGEGLNWEDTDLFQHYAKQLREGTPVRRGKSILELKAAYTATVDKLYNRIKSEGFILSMDRNQRENDLPHVHIGRDGEILFGNGGNHRLSIARFLNLTRMPCVVHARHTLWQELREEIFDRLSKSGEIYSPPEHVGHPDLDDLLANADVTRRQDSI